MARYAVIRQSDLLVVNIIDWRGTLAQLPTPVDHVLVESATAVVDDSWDGARFARKAPGPPVPVPPLPDAAIRASASLRLRMLGFSNEEIDALLNPPVVGG